ncbi:hypothetical protein Sango_2480400 [Sesamum angolense]|uniref:Reverse transcriptase zinc-binding domain-containing protein n=1 Tax=Sesamum angolense TaxID=2727404 RepID=A0AAE1W3P7_9LAMI|nr:hypothetical protein Sango_2480400 [Sesamum angolense]
MEVDGRNRNEELLRKEFGEEDQIDEAGTSVSYGQGNNLPSGWSLLWRAKILPKVKLLVWRACKDALLVYCNLRHRGMNITTTCNRRGYGSEDVLHVLLRHVHWTQQLMTIGVGIRHMRESADGLLYGLVSVVSDSNDVQSQDFKASRVGQICEGSNCFGSAGGDQKSKEEVKEDLPQFVEKGLGLVSVSEEIDCLTNVVDIKLEALKIDMSLSDDASTNRERIETREVLKKELNYQFIPCNTNWVARESLRNLRHTGMVREFVKEFNSLMLDVRDMSKEHKLFNFMRNDDSEKGKAKFSKKFKKKEKTKEVVTDTSEPRAVEKSRVGCFICGNLEHQARITRNATGLDIKPWDSQVKAVNSKAVPVSKIANTKLSVGSCTRQCGNKPTFVIGEYDGGTIAAGDDGHQHKPYAGVGRSTIGLCWYNDTGLVNDTWYIAMLSARMGEQTSMGRDAPEVGKQHAQRAWQHAHTVGRANDCRQRSRLGGWVHELRHGECAGHVMRRLRMTTAHLHGNSGMMLARRLWTISIAVASSFP